MTNAATLLAAADVEICSDASSEQLEDSASNRRRCGKALVGVSASLAALAVIAAAFAASGAPAASGAVGHRVADTLGAISVQEVVEHGDLSNETATAEDSVHGAAALSSGAEEPNSTNATDNSTYASREEDTGCGSWRRIAFHEAITTMTEEECLQLCIGQPGCKYANFQHVHPGSGEPGDHCNPNYALNIGACYTFADDCVKAKNPCWVLLEPKPEDVEPAAFVLVKTETGCSNWRSAKIGDVKMVLNHYECSWTCQMAEGCVQFNYQEEDCEGGAHHCKEQVGKGACYLFSELCEEETNEFWDLYGMLQIVDPTESTTEDNGVDTTQNTTEDNGSEATTTSTTDTNHVSPLPGP